jgi:predicted dienelactone hydrolase
MVTKRVFMGLLIVMLALPALLIAPFAGAQEGKPEAKGLRPDAPPYALHGPYWVGAMQLTAKTDLHNTNVVLRYPALNPDKTEEATTYSNFGVSVEGHAILNATPDIEHGPYPLVIWAHGNNGANILSAYLGEHLASYGFVVLAIDYADNPATAGSIPVYSMLYTRPRDVSWQIDYTASLTAAGGKLEGMIDTEHTAVVGHSAGGYTALAAGGSRLDLKWLGHVAAEQPEVCMIPPALGGGNQCTDILDHQQELADLAGLERAPEGLWPSWADPRVDAVVSLAPGGWATGGPEGLKGVSIPAMVMGGSMDRVVSSEFGIYQPYDYLGSAEKSLVVFEGADHFVFIDGCDAVPWLIEMGAFYACSDPVWDMDRAHDLINHFTTAFLLATLKGDQDAAAALAPDQVQFPGIQYQAQGF